MTRRFLLVRSWLHSLQARAVFAEAGELDLDQAIVAGVFNQGRAAF